MAADRDGRRAGAGRELGRSGQPGRPFLWSLGLNGCRWKRGAQHVDGVWMRPEIRAMSRLDKIMEPLSEGHRREVLDHLLRAWRRPLSGTERTRRWRDGSSTEKRDGASTLDGDGASTRKRDEPSAKERDGVSTIRVDEPSRTPPTPPVVSSFFEQFWSCYPKRVGKGAARKSWKKQNCENKGQIILDALQQQRAFLNREGGKFIPNPATWLNQNRWEDEPPTLSILTQKTSGNADAARAFVEEKSRQ